MANCKIPISSRSVYNKVSLFLALLLPIIITGCSLPKAAQPTAEEEYNAQTKFLELQSDVDNEDYITAGYVLGNFKKNYSGTHFYKMYSKRIEGLAKTIGEKTKDIKVEDRIEYLFIPPRLETKIWKEYMSRAERMISQNQDRVGITVLRVIFEDESIEKPSVRSDWNSNNDLHIYLGYGGGYSAVGSFQSGEPVFVGSGFYRYRQPYSDSNDISTSGNILIGGIYHYSTKLKIDVQKGKAAAFGEIIVRTIPQKFRGNLKVTVKTEEGFKLTNANVSLGLEGFMPGKTEPVKDNNCLFSSIGPGRYRITMVSDMFGSADQTASVVPGQTTEVVLNAYRKRVIELDWRFRNVNEPNNWLSGRKTMKTKEYWQPDNEWIDVHYPVLEFSDWTGDTCNIKRYNGELMHVDSNGPFETMDFPSNFSPFSRDYPIKEGDIFAWRRNEPKEKALEALIRIRKITPIGMPD